MSQLVARRGLRDLLVHSRVNCNMFARCVSAASVVRRAGDTNKPTLVHDWCGGFVGCNIRSEHVQVYLMGDFNMRWRRMCSASATEKKDEKPRLDTVRKDQDGGGSVTVPSYWGIETAKMKIARKDGSKWPWNCFMPWETHQADLTIDFKKHHVPKNMADKIAYVIVKILRVPTDIFFQRRYGCRAMMLETVAAVPGMVGGMLLHLKSIRRFEHSGGWIKALLEEAENERMHLMTMMELVKPKWYERLLVILVQGVFFSSFFTCYVLSPRLAHRIVGYLEEEAIHSYTEFLKDIDDGKIENVKAPAIAIDYWRLPEDATLKDVVTVIRADEAHHRDVNHFASDIRNQGKELREAAAPIGYH
ncbi:ubiquinol oxidase 2, mitochondrial [Brassica rapa]|uniref:ubiquinol oxidase 2, mitochondrial n=1 Tax=Brassica campestris TaxID=3711 RepID=UPI0004F13F20|nr:ubiquinol oxidase 2, mitochondrial [Brassica rapa]